MALSARLVASASPAGSSGPAEQRPLAPWNPTAVPPALTEGQEDGEENVLGKDSKMKQAPTLMPGTQQPLEGSINSHYKEHKYNLRAPPHQTPLSPILGHDPTPTQLAHCSSVTGPEVFYYNMDTWAPVLEQMIPTVKKGH